MTADRPRHGPDLEADDQGGALLPFIRPTALRRRPPRPAPPGGTAA